MGTVPSGPVIAAPCGNFMVDPYGNFMIVPNGVFNPMHTPYFATFPPWTGSPCATPHGNLFPMHPGNFTSVPNGNFSIVPHLNFNTFPHRNFNTAPPKSYNKVDSPLKLNNVPARNIASQGFRQPSVREYSKNPERYPGFVLVMVLSTGKMEVMSRREAYRNTTKVKIVSSPSRSDSSSFFRR